MDSWPSEEAMMKMAMEKAFGVRPVKAVLGLDLVCVFESKSRTVTWNRGENSEGVIENDHKIRK
jgi:hypothetical protein